MKIASKALMTILMTSMLTLTASSGVAALDIGLMTKEASRSEKKLSRLYKKHDRKLELRAATLGMDVDELKLQMKDKDFAAILKKHGFKNERDFQVATVGKTKDELKRRGWSEEKMIAGVNKRLQRLN